MSLIIRSLIYPLKLSLSLVFSTSLIAGTKNTSEPVGSLSFVLPAGSPVSPSYKIASSGLNGKVVFRGQVKQVNGADVVFNRVPDLLDPTILSWPFSDGILASRKARFLAVLDANDSGQSILGFDLLDGGAGYVTEPKVYISMPSDGNVSWQNHEPAVASSSIALGSVTSINLEPDYRGKGYQQMPSVEIQGGRHFLRCVESGSLHEGKFFLIVSNTGDTITVENPLAENLNVIFQSNAMVEVFEAWTLGSLFGYSSTQLQQGDSSIADYIYLLKPPEQQDGTAADYIAHFHDGVSWREVNGSNASTSSTLIYPDESFILARRSPSPLEISLFGVALTQDSFVQIPSVGKRFLMNNPFGVDVMLSDLIPTVNLTSDPSETQKWFTSLDQELADNVELLRDGVWTSFWHDGTNLGVSEAASLTARQGTGVAGSMTLQDLSMSAGIITAMTNPRSGNIIVTSHGHSLSNGLTVKISNAYGHKTNDDSPKQQVDENGNIVSSGDGLVVESNANGLFQIGEITPNTFELVNKSGNCDFMGEANWKTGTKGAGYTSNAYVSFVGGGGKGAQGVAHVVNGSVQSITLTNPGNGYESAPKVFVHSGGWRSFGAGSSPFNDVLIPAGSGIHLFRNLPNGLASILRVGNPLE
ncbi:MAG: hypothetical protein P8O23_08850 [Opitutales bacterium]|nr:hypothetical protein [Opitutales bacterium]